MADQNVKPAAVVPPGDHIKHTGHHWLEVKDLDGHSFGLIVLQWQPYAQQWCNSGRVGEGQVEDVTYHEYVAPCPLPKQT